MSWIIDKTFELDINILNRSLLCQNIMCMNIVIH